jgi:hypothetical protein
MRTLVASAALAVACGKVGDAPQHIVDASPDALSCRASQMLCGVSCTDPMTDGSNCGECGNTCSVAEGCVAGHCTDMATSCKDLLAINPMTPTGAYTLPNGDFVFCDMGNGGVTYRSLDYGQYNVAVTGEDLVTVADLGSATLQSAFVALYNHQGGANLIAAWNDGGSCCFKFDASINELHFGANNVDSSSGSAAQCGAHSAQVAQFALVSAAGAFTFEPTSLPTNFFSTNGASAANNCADIDNPAFFWKREMP